MEGHHACKNSNGTIFLPYNSMSFFLLKREFILQEKIKRVGFKNQLYKFYNQKKPTIKQITYIQDKVKIEILI
jgi:hypothetical protein